MPRQVEDRCPTGRLRRPELCPWSASLPRTSRRRVGPARTAQHALCLATQVGRELTSRRWPATLPRPCPAPHPAHDALVHCPARVWIRALLPRDLHLSPPLRWTTSATRPQPRWRRSRRGFHLMPHHQPMLPVRWHEVAPRFSGAATLGFHTWLLRYDKRATASCYTHRHVC